MQRTPLSIVQLRGSALDIAYQLGKLRSRKIFQRVEYWNQHLAQLYRGHRATLQRLEKEFLRETQLQANPYLAEIRAMAEGAGLPFRELFRLNLTELSSYVDKCTDLILPMQTRQGRRILLAHNEDWNPRRNDVFILKAQLPDQSYAVLAYDGYLPGLSAGLNSDGLCHSVNYLRPRDHRIGLPRIFITRFLVTARSFKECLNYIGSMRRAFGQAIHLAQKERYLGLELTAQHLWRQRPRLPAAHSNHYLHPQAQAPRDHPLRSSLQRLETAKRLLREKYPHSKGLSPLQARRMASQILRDRSALPYALWREADSHMESSATLAMVLIGTDRPQLQVSRKRLPQSCRKISL